MKTKAIGVATLLLLPIFFSFASATAPYQESQYQIFQPTNDNNTVTIIIKSGQFDMKTGTIRGILGYTISIENRGTKWIRCHSSSVQYTLLSHQYIGYFNASGNVPSQWAWSVSRIPVLYLRPFMTITVKATVNTSMNLTLERSGIELFSSFFIFSGIESITGPS